MLIFDILKPLVLLGFLAAAAVTDTLHHKIYNSLIIAGFISEAALHLIRPPETEIYAAVYLLIFILILIIFFNLKMLGGADVKLYMLTVFAYPDGRGLKIVLFSVLFGAFYSVLLLIKKKAGTGQRLPFPAAGGNGGAEGGRRRLTLPMGIFIFAGACITLL